MRDSPRPADVFRVFLGLGLTSFGGPAAHIGYFREAFVRRRGWLSDAQFAQALALCQFLPGPASSQLGFVIGWQRAGLAGALAAFAGFTLPSALVLVGLAAWLGAAPAQGVLAGALAGLKVTAAAVVAHALWGMARALTPDAARLALAGAAAAGVMAAPSPALAQIGAIMAGLAVGAGFGLGGGGRDGNGSGSGGGSGGALRPAPDAGLRAPPRAVALGCGAVLLGLGAALPALAGAGVLAQLADVVYRAGALVFGGGHVVLPLLEAGTVGTGLVSAEGFLAGYGAAQAVPGPLFTFAGWLGFQAAGLAGAALALVMVFAPGFLLVMAALPWWAALAARAGARSALAGANAAVVGILAAALYDPIITRGLHGWADAALAVVLFAALAGGRVPAWAVALAGALCGAAGLVGAA